jgi:cytochrome b6-f complex iron-sulfur subunit
LLGAAGLAFISAGFASLIAFPSGLLYFLRRRLPQSTLEPSSVFHLGYPADFATGVDTRFLQIHRICVVRNADRLYLLYTRCTHQGCTPDWIAATNKFRCPCHGSHFCVGSAFDGDGLNCEEPAPRPLD